MSTLATTRVGWCPGTLRPMASGDGLVLRIKPRGGALSLAQARRIADVSRRCGNAAIDITGRANLQIRGVVEATLPKAITALDDAGLVDGNAAAEAVRNVVSSPLAGFDQGAILDIRPVVAALEARLADDASLHGLPPKFGFVVDDGGDIGLGDVPSDIRFEAFLSYNGAAVFAITLGTDSGSRGVCEVDDLVEGAATLARQLIAANLDDPDIRHMRHLVRRDGAQAIFGRAGLATFASSPFAGEDPRGQGFSAREPRAVTAFAPYDAHRLDRLLRGSGYVGVAVPFGRLDAGQLDVLVSAADEAGAAELRLTPWRVVLVPGLRGEAARNVVQICKGLGLIVDAGDPRLAVAACPGAPGCHRGSTSVLDHAKRLAARLAPSMLRRGITLHVSGCGKGCAHVGQAAFTMVGHDGLYDIVIAGRAADAPSVRNLSFENAEGWLRNAIGGEWP